MIIRFDFGKHYQELVLKHYKIRILSTNLQFHQTKGFWLLQVLYFVTLGNPHIRLYDIHSQNPNPITVFEGHTKNVTAIQFQSQGRWFVTGSEDGTIKIFDVRAPGIQRDYTPDPRSPVNDVIIHPNQGELISCDQDGSIRVWDLGENICTHLLLPDEDTPVRSITMASDGSLLIAANNKVSCS
jgi:G protein beta subunit-like protein